MSDAIHNFNSYDLTNNNFLFFSTVYDRLNKWPDSEIQNPIQNVKTKMQILHGHWITTYYGISYL